MSTGRIVRGAVHGLGELCITLGVVLLLFVAWQLWWTDVAAGQTQRQLTQQLEHQWQVPPHASGKAPSTTVKEIPMGDAFALIRIPRFGHDYVRPILQGVGLDVLQRGVGHYPDTAKPGEVGNFAVAGHRVTYAKPFNRIAELKPGDAIVVETRDTWYVYRVKSHTIVTPDRVDVVAPVPEHPGDEPTQRMMTMTACHPEFSARERYVVFSELDEVLPKTGGAIPEALR
ncbi:MAG TPA: class E sortase [Actinomycetales bacterium]|nr:class E sortase [Actinomycetales bacterium]